MRRVGWSAPALASLLVAFAVASQPTLAGFQDSASVAASFAVPADPSPPQQPQLVSVASGATAMLSMTGARAQRYDMSGAGWQRVADAPFVARALAACDDGFLATDGQSWAHLGADGSWTERPAPFSGVTVLAGTTTCVASDGQQWAVSPDGGATWTTTPATPTRPSGAIAASQAGPTVLASDGSRLWQSPDLGQTWQVVSIPPPPDSQPLLVEDQLVNAAGAWFAPSGGLDVWLRDATLSALDLGDPIAGGTDSAGRLLVTDGVQWFVVQRQTGQVAPFPAPPPL